MNICFLSSVNPFDIRSWSGTLYHMTAFFEKQNTVEWIGDNIISQHYAFRSKEEYYPEFYAQLYGKILSERINRSNHDVVIVRDYFLGAYLDVNRPIVYIGDTTFRLFKENLNIPSIEFENVADNLEKKMIDNSDCIIFSSNRAKQSAVKDYNCLKDKIHVVEFEPISRILRNGNTISTQAYAIWFYRAKLGEKGGDKVWGHTKTKKRRFPLCTHHYWQHTT